MSLNDIFGPAPFGGRPEHEDFRKLVDIVLQHDGKTEDPGYDREAYLNDALDADSAGYMAFNRCLRFAHMVGLFNPKARAALTDRDLTVALTNLWIDAFMIGHNYRQRNET